MKKLTIFAALSAAIVMGAPVQATPVDTVTETFTIPQQDLPFTESFSLPAFDLPFELLSVEFILTTEFIASIDVINVTDSEQTYTDATATLDSFVVGPFGLRLDANPTAGPVDGTVPDGDPFGIDSQSGLVATDMDSILLDDPAALPPFQGPQSLDFAFAALTGEFSGTSVPGVFFGGSGTAGATFQIIYTFIIPEPSSLSLIALGGLGLVMVSRKALRRA